MLVDSRREDGGSAYMHCEALGLKLKVLRLLFRLPWWHLRRSRDFATCSPSVVMLWCHLGTCLRCVGSCVLLLKKLWFDCNCRQATVRQNNLRELNELIIFPQICNPSGRTLLLIICSRTWPEVVSVLCTLRTKCCRSGPHLLLPSSKCGFVLISPWGIRNVWFRSTSRIFNSRHYISALATNHTLINSSVSTSTKPLWNHHTLPNAQYYLSRPFSLNPTTFRAVNDEQATFTMIQANSPDFSNRMLPEQWSEQ